MIEQIITQKNFEQAARRRITSFLNRDIDNQFVKELLGRDFISTLMIQEIPSRTPLLDYMDKSSGKTEDDIMFSAYFWGGLNPQSLERSHLTPKDFANVLGLIYNQRGDLYHEVSDKPNFVLESFNKAYNSLRSERSNVIKL